MRTVPNKPIPPPATVYTMKCLLLLLACAAAAARPELRSRRLRRDRRGRHHRRQRRAHGAEDRAARTAAAHRRHGLRRTVAHRRRQARSHRRLLARVLLARRECLQHGAVPAGDRLAGGAQRRGEHFPQDAGRRRSHRALPSAPAREGRRAQIRRAHTGHHHGERRAVHRADVRRLHLRRRPHGAGRGDLHLGARKLGAIRRIAGRRARRDSLSSVPGRSLAQGRRRQTAARDFRRAGGRTRLGRPHGAGLQLPHDSLARSGEPGGVPEARALRSRRASNSSPACSTPCRRSRAARRAWAKCSPSSPCPIKRPTSTTTGPSPRITSARAGTIPTPATRAARRSGAITRSTPRSCSGSSPTTRACRRRYRKRSTNGAWPRTSSWIPITGRTSSTSAKRAAWWAST